jgi:hypothetical protein
MSMSERDVMLHPIKSSEKYLFLNTPFHFEIILLTLLKIKIIKKKAYQDILLII